MNLATPPSRVGQIMEICKDHFHYLELEKLIFVVFLVRVLMFSFFYGEGGQHLKKGKSYLFRFLSMSAGV